MRTWLVVLALAGCDHVFGLGDPYQDARGSTNGSDAASDVMPADGAQGDGSGRQSPMLIAHFPFDVDLRNTVDQQPGICVGTSCSVVSTGGHLGGMLALDGSSCLKFGLNQTPAQFTIALWVDAGSTAQSTLVARALTPTSMTQTWKIDANINDHAFSTYDGANQVAQLTGPGLVMGTWSHVAVTYDGVNKRIYLDGVPEIMTAATAVSTADANVYLGCEAGATTEKLKGSVDEVYIYDGALDDMQVAQLFGN